MNSIKKALLLTCLAGSVASMHAGRWDDFKNSCSGLYTACVQSLGNGSNTVSTKVCDAYASCVKAMCNGAHSVATTASNTASTIKDTTVKVTTPVITPVVSATKSSANGLVTAAQFTYENPKLVGAGILATIASYVAYCRNSTQNWYPAIDQAKQITSNIDTHINLKDWRTIKANNEPALSIAEIVAGGNLDPRTHLYSVYASFKKDKGNTGESHDVFIDRMSVKLAEDQKNLKVQKDNLKKYCLSECYILPSLRSRFYHEDNNFVDNLINERISIMNDSERFIDLSREDIGYINNQVTQKITPSYFNPLKVARQYALPYEAETIKQYWILINSIQRLEALKELLKKQRNELNK